MNTHISIPKEILSHFHLLTKGGYVIPLSSNMDIAKGIFPKDILDELCMENSQTISLIGRHYDLTGLSEEELLADANNLFASVRDKFAMVDFYKVEIGEVEAKFFYRYLPASMVEITIGKESFIPCGTCNRTCRELASMCEHFQMELPVNIDEEVHTFVLCNFSE